MNEKAHYDDCVIFLLAKAYQKAHQNFKKRLQKYNLTPIQHLILEALWVADTPSAGELGRALSLDGATLSGVLDRLADGGWIYKNPDPEDKRVVRIHLTDKSTEKRPELVRERDEANQDILDGFSIEEKVLLKRLLRDVVG